MQLQVRVCNKNLKTRSTEHQTHRDHELVHGAMIDGSTCLSLMAGLAGRSSKYLLPVARRMSGGSAGSLKRPECGDADGLAPGKGYNLEAGLKAY